jgi:outer membrane protein TolC
MLFCSSMIYTRAQVLKIFKIPEQSMILQKRIFTFLLTGIFLSASFFAQEKLTLTIERSVELALAQNPQLQIAEKELARAKAGVGEAYSVILPQLDVYANFQHNWEIQTSRIPNFIKPMLGPLAEVIPEIEQMPDYVDIAFGLENTINYGATVRQPLFLGWSGIAGIQAAKAGARAAEYNVNMRKQDLIYQSASTFYACLLARELIDVREEALTEARANLEVVNKRYNVGAASGFDRMRAEVEVANLEPELISARNDYQFTLTTLRNILGLDRDTEIEISGEFVYIDDDLSNLSLAEIQDLALAERPEIKALSEQKTIARQGVIIARSNFLPKLFFQTDYSYLAMKNDLRFRQDDFSKGFYSAINLQIPLFHGFRSKKQYQKAKLEQKIMLDMEKQLRDAIIAEVEIAYNKFMEAKEKYLSASKTVEMATEALRLANLMYVEGANTQVDVLSSRLALTRARLSYATSLFEYQAARYQLRRAAGKLEGVI